MNIDFLTSQIIKGAINVHQTLGPGLLESVYLECMAIELKELNLKFEREVPLKVRYRNQSICGEGFRLDLLVESTVVLELKSVEEIKPVHHKQLLTYLRLAKKPVGLLMNFNVPVLKDGVKRIVSEEFKKTPDFQSQKIRSKRPLCASLISV
jgi:GxxExxY protein